MRTLKGDILEYLNSPKFTYDVTRSYYNEQGLSMMSNIIDEFCIPITLDVIDNDGDSYTQACIYVKTKSNPVKGYNVVFDLDAQFNGSTKEELAEHMMGLIEGMTKCYNNLQLGLVR